MRFTVVVMAIALVAAPAAAQSMNAEAFHQRATKLQSRGAMAVFSMGEVKLLMKEGQAAGQAAAAIIKAEKAAGRPRVCAPDGPQKMDSKEFMARLSAIPQSTRRKIDMTEATIRILETKFPC